ncbi:MAG: hypothetical protein NT069_22075 [Planctomycetota bacterium]|nr:hypothetical protein [Planctomycetota bacterium]
MLAVGYEYNNPVTSVARVAQYQILADRLQEWLGDIIYTGGATLEGLDYQWINLNRKVNLAGHDGDGASLTTGWESIGAYVTDVEYDFEERITTLTISSNQMELIGEDPELTKKKLNIKALEARAWVNFYFNTYFRNRTISDAMPLLGDMGMKVQVTDMKFDYGVNYVDPWNNAVQGMPTGAGL